MFLSPARPFYQSTAMMNIDCIPIDNYCQFAQEHFAEADKTLPAEVFQTVYERFEGITWYVQRIMNELYVLTPTGNACSTELIEVAIDNILRSNEFTYQSMLFQLPPKQKELLIALSKAGKAEAITSTKFIQRWHLSSSSSVQSAIKGLLDKNFVTSTLGVYEVYDRFFALWLTRK